MTRRPVNASTCRTCPVWRICTFVHAMPGICSEKERSYWSGKERKEIKGCTAEVPQSSTDFLQTKSKRHMDRREGNKDLESVDAQVKYLNINWKLSRYSRSHSILSRIIFEDNQIVDSAQLRLESVERNFAYYIEASSCASIYHQIY